MELIHSDAWVGIGIGERDFWSKGYGTDMMKVCLRYAFLELGMQRVALGLHAYNPRALRSYEKAGFQLEGRTRQDVLREGKRTDTLWMGILREEWLHCKMERRHERYFYRKTCALVGVRSGGDEQGVSTLVSKFGISAPAQFIGASPCNLQRLS